MTQSIFITNAVDEEMEIAYDIDNVLVFPPYMVGQDMIIPDFHDEIFTITNIWWHSYPMSNLDPDIKEDKIVMVIDVKVKGQ